jgi:hypothetical protein
MNAGVDPTLVARLLDKASTINRDVTEARAKILDAPPWLRPVLEASVIPELDNADVTGALIGEAAAGIDLANELVGELRQSHNDLIATVDVLAGVLRRLEAEVRRMPKAELEDRAELLSAALDATNVLDELDR